MSNAILELAKICQDLNLLYVEDDKDARASTTSLLKNFFKNITVAEDGLDGLQKFKESKFDLILTDINMPELNGIEMLEEIRNIDPDISVLMLSAYNDSQYIMRAIELNVDGYILKPLNHSQFIKVLSKTVEKINLLNMKDNYQKHLENEVEKRSKEIEYKLLYDSLTSLYSRYKFFHDLSSLKNPVIILIDINQFKVINEVYGSEMGSVVLKEFGKFLAQTIQDTDYKAYRLSGDEYAILDSNEFIDKNKHDSLISLLLNRLNHLKLNIENISILIDSTLGVSLGDKNSYESAKIALEYAKKNKKSQTIFSKDIDHRKETSQTLICRDNIAAAIDDDRVVAVFQPIVDANKNVLKHETLMRLRDKDTQTLLSPFHFLDVAIKTRQYDSLSSSVVFSALETIKKTSKSLSINFTYSDIKNTAFINEVENILVESQDIGPKMIIEITENESIENYDEVKSFITRFRRHGVKIAIDDFGTGFSNFQYILEIEPDYLKIDGSLVRDIDTNHKAYTLVEAIVQFSHKLGIKVIAEFVHSEEIFNMLRQLDVDEYQGFYFSEPLERLA